MPFLVIVQGCDHDAGVTDNRKLAEEAFKHDIDGLSPEQRNATFLRAIRDSGYDCQHVVGSAYNGLQFGMHSWATRCGDGRDWLVMLRRDGQVYVSPREELKVG